MNHSTTQIAIKEIEEIEARLSHLRRRLIATLPSENNGAGNLENKREDGRLSDVGVKAVEAAYDAGATVMEVSRQFEITPSAASNRRKIWLSNTSRKG